MVIAELVNPNHEIEKVSIVVKNISVISISKINVLTVIIGNEKINIQHDDRAIMIEQYEKILKTLKNLEEK